MGEVFLTTLSTNDYLPGVLVLNKTISEHCIHKLVVLVSDDLDRKTYEALDRFHISYIKQENKMSSDVVGKSNGGGSYYSYWINTLFKLKIFDLIQFDKVVYIDSDMMVQMPIDELFYKEDMSAVIAGKSYPGNEKFKDMNSGVLVFRPRKEVLKELIAMIPQVAGKKKYFGDQDILGEYFTDWKDRYALHLPEEYNVFWRYYDFYQKRSSVKVVHFIGKVKPWMMSGIQVAGEYFKCVCKGKFRAISVMRKYRCYLKELWQVLEEVAVG